MFRKDISSFLQSPIMDFFYEFSYTKEVEVPTNKPLIVGGKKVDFGAGPE